ncbi:MAG: hypothetical protein LUG51_04715 [Tannerellaceae bacterium]|nr:hypothetical protein [Tannerellaceae bacterium]
MANQDKIKELLQDIRTLNRLVENIQEAEIYPVSFFSQTFDLAHLILTRLHTLETEQVDALRKQMEAHQAFLQSIPVSKPIPQPVLPEETVPVAQDSSTVSEPETVRAPEEIEAEVELPLEQTEQIPFTFSVQEPQEPAEENPFVSPEVEETVREIKQISPDKPAIDKSNISLNEILAKKRLADFRKAFSLNDRFYFRKELFAGNEEKMNQTIGVLNDIQSYEESITYLKEELQWDMENPCVADFIRLLEKRFL